MSGFKGRGMGGGGEGNGNNTKRETWGRQKNINSVQLPKNVKEIPTII